MYSGVVIGVDELGGYVVVDYIRNREVSVIHNYVKTSNIGSVYLKDLLVDFGRVNKTSKELVDLVLSRYQEFLVVIKEAKLEGYRYNRDGNIEVDVSVVFYDTSCSNYLARWCSDEKLTEYNDTIKVILKKFDSGGE